MVQRVRRYRASMDKEVSWLPSSRTDSQYTLMPGSSSIMGCHCWTIFDDDAVYSGSNTESLDSSTTMSLSFSSSPHYPVLGNDGIHECVTRGAHIGFLLSLPTLATDAQFVPESILSLSGSKAHITKVGTLLAHHLVLTCAILLPAQVSLWLRNCQPLYLSPIRPDRANGRAALGAQKCNPEQSSRSSPSHGARTARNNSNCTDGMNGMGSFQGMDINGMSGLGSDLAKARITWSHKSPI
ncbi:uncharacterized protein BKA55DRAFT_719675 [Fusarium redolens]|uniref:Uncharacterized protein n=1 Tax=Fusarium redolens TaxID=48865 RepID=A0A9P9FY50_FUSRE|nr:uncharacterized protein BKA55DRAFT_719675 [Fusarium redolens]KAH7213376.1 hypothetical protein BKA55DRAFT_719675 [Fusarium redolens]